MTSILSLVFSFVAAFAAAAAFVRTVFHELPTAEFLVTRDASGLASYKLSVSNPTRRLLVLDHIKVLSPDTMSSFARPADSMRHTEERVWKDLRSPDPEKRGVHLAVPAGETKYLEILFGSETDDEGFEVDFRPVWSKHDFQFGWWEVLLRPGREGLPQGVKLDSAQVKSRNLAALESGKD